jgi:hypothetical protein
MDDIKKAFDEMFWPGAEFARQAAKESHANKPNLTLRYYYAGLAMQGLCINARIGYEGDIEGIAEPSVALADALIAELEKVEP